MGSIAAQCARTLFYIRKVLSLLWTSSLQGKDGYFTMLQLDTRRMFIALNAVAAIVVYQAFYVRYQVWHLNTCHKRQWYRSNVPSCVNALPLYARRIGLIGYAPWKVSGRLVISSKGTVWHKTFHFGRRCVQNLACASGRPGQNIASFSHVLIMRLNAYFSSYYYYYLKLFENGSPSAIKKN